MQLISLVFCSFLVIVVLCFGVLVYQDKVLYQGIFADYKNNIILRIGR